MIYEVIISNIKNEIKKIESYCIKIRKKIWSDVTKKGDNLIWHISDIEESKNNLIKIIDGKEINNKHKAELLLLTLFMLLPFIWGYIIYKLWVSSNDIKSFVLFPFFIVII
jgi:hypothetical protein